jgi:putative transcriptional regulator
MNLYIFTDDNSFEANYKLKNRIKVNRAEKNITQKQLGDLIYVTRQTIAVIEQGNQIPSLEVAVKIACIFGKKIEDVFYYEKEE